VKRDFDVVVCLLVSLVSTLASKRNAFIDHCDRLLAKQEINGINFQNSNKGYWCSNRKSNPERDNPLSNPLFANETK
jgi:hypothetical protein